MSDFPPLMSLQAGVAFGTGPVNDYTQRVVLASGGEASSTVSIADVAVVDNALSIRSSATDPSLVQLTAINGNTPALGNAAMAASSPVTIASDDTLTAAANALLGTIDADTGVIAGDTTSLDAKQPALGTAAMAASSPVTIATDDTMITALDAAMDIVAGDTTSLDGKTPALGTAAMAASSPVTISSNDTLTVAANASLATIAGWDATQDDGASTTGSQLMVEYNSTKPTAVGTGDAVKLQGDSYGRLLAGVEPEWFNAVYDSADARAEGQVIKAATASKKIYVTSIIISSDIEGWVKLQDEDSNALTGKFWLKAGGGVSHQFPDNTPLVLNVVNKALEIIAENAGDISCTVTGYLAP